MTEALQAIIGEFKTLSSDVVSTAVFTLDGETLAASGNVTPEQTQLLIVSLSGLTHAGCIGGIEHLSVQDINSQVSVASVGDVYLAAVASRMGDQKVVKSLTEVVAPAAIRLALKMPKALEAQKINREELLMKIEAALPKKDQPETVTTQSATETQAAPIAPKVPSTQFMVERIGGLLVASDTVRIDSRVLADWTDACGKQLTSVCVETLEGKTVTCKFKPQKDGKGTIGIPEKILQTLECEKGKLVMVRPVIEIEEA